MTNLSVNYEVTDREWSDDCLNHNQEFYQLNYGHISFHGIEPRLPRRSQGVPLHQNDDFLIAGVGFEPTITFRLLGYEPSELDLYSIPQVVTVGLEPT